MRVLVITGDKRFGPGHGRYELQRAAVDELSVVYWGPHSLFPKLPAGHFDVVTTQDPFFRGLVGWYAARKLGAKLNVQVHVDLHSVGFIKYVVGQIVLRHADSIRVVSEKIKSQVGQTHARVIVLPVYVDLGRFKAVVRNPESGTVLWTGRFEDEKDPLLAVEVLKKVLAQGIDAKLIMLGTGSLEPQLKATAQGLPVEFPGWQDPLPYLAQASVALCTSRHESWGASIVEALAAGVPVVAPDVGIAAEAGATVAERAELAGAVAEALTSGAKGELQISIPSKEEWVKQWLQSLN